MGLRSPAKRFSDLDRSNGLYRPEYEHAACGVGFVANVSGLKEHRILEMALTAVINLTHRGAVDADAKTGDGAGVLTQLPYKLLQRELRSFGLAAPRPQDLALGMLFLPQDHLANRRCRQIVEEVIRHNRLMLLGWRQVPVDSTALGDKARATQPDICQVLIARPQSLDPSEYERSLYLTRKMIEARVSQEKIEGFYVPSFSSNTLVYKGLLVAPQLPKFYKDLVDPDFQTALAVFHQRYSTNTFPNWFLAQPFRMLAHNGEINTLQGNEIWIRAREPELFSDLWKEKVEHLKPIIQRGGSDSAKLDNVLEALVLSGRDVRHSLMMLVPEAWEKMPNMDPAWREFYEYHASITEPWDGPAALAFSDGTIVGATLDRNGLRPARYKVTDTGLVVMASEVGVLDLDETYVVEKGRLGPGEMIAIDTQKGLLLKNREVKDHFSRQRPYGEWVRRHQYSLSEHVARVNGNALPTYKPSLGDLRAFGYTSEELHLVLRPMATEGLEPTGSMGNDTPLGVLATKPRLLYTYFKQKFAQVTNPPIDSLREQLVMSLNTYLGARRSLLEESPEHAKLFFHPSPVLVDNELEALRSIPDPAFTSATLSTLFPVGQGPDGLKPALERLCSEASQAIERGVSLLILSDRGVNGSHASIPVLLAVGAVHHHLIRAGKRMKASLMVESGEVWEMHQFATLFGYGASAVNPYMALASINKLLEEEHFEGLTLEKAVANYRKTIDKQLLKIMSKMGISAISAYHGAQIFEVIGINTSVVEECFTGTPSSVGGIGYREIAQEVLERHRIAFGTNPNPKLENVGYYGFRKIGETHAFSPTTIKLIHGAVESGGYADYQKYLEHNYGLEPVSLRDLLRFAPGTPIRVEEVEPATEIVKRISSASMSLGALSPEAHETLAIAMNRMGTRSNTGEGGEDPARYRASHNGDSPNSKIKQVASGRFGVTPEYLAMADELEIKMAQGSKPGEGGQLPGHKVVAHIARIRHTQPGIALISPPPHHDIYSIEDLSQLIYDLKVANPRARVTVKLVAEAGVGTIAAGVAKGYADVVHISGHEGGTGASPLSSIKNAGSPWELGIAETHQTLVLNDLRNRVTLRTDGGFRTGRDVVIAAMLGAEQYAFGTAAVVSIGCTMARQCHLNTCPVGVATQRPDLRAKFTGTPEHAIRFFFFVAEEVRQILASLGFHSLNEVIGRSELLKQQPLPGHPKANTLDLSRLTAQVDPQGTRPRYHLQARNDRPGDVPLDEMILKDAKKALEGKESVSLKYSIKNIHRTVGARVAGEIALRYGDKGLPEGVNINCSFKGSAGQSFGAFCIDGLNLFLEGEANDYVAKGIHGGQLVVKPSKVSTYPTHRNVIMGNTVLYGATGGFLFAAGRAGERFAVRNSGAQAVVEGTGDHCCEYMTGGVVVVLGETGRNFGAGMSGGMAYVLDQAGDFHTKHNPELVGIAPVTEKDDIETLHYLITRHVEVTGSPRALDILEKWNEYLPRFKRVLAHALAAAREKAKQESQVPAKA